MGGMEVLYHMIFTRILTITFTKGRKDFSFRNSSAADSSTVDSSAADSSTVDSSIAASFAADSSTSED